MKLYTNPTCHYCKKIKESLDTANITYEEINASENVVEWNELLRVTGIGITPTIMMQEEIWIPNRDFRTPDELIQRIRHFEEHPMVRLNIEERIDQVNNNVKNLTLILNQMQQTLQQINAKQTTPPNFNHQTAPTQPQQTQPQQ
tara:strand:+ start:5309 stop:5740 length:432 start_codon:yes stop_codon:yes gene_type:complete